MDQQQIPNPISLINSILTKEVCVESLAESIFAERQGVNRIELCSRLDLDGPTPDEGLIQETLSALSIPVKVMIRPRDGNFINIEDELKLMENAIDHYSCGKYYR
ncbi:MAG: copper homeostasis protein CutC [Candidatus Marinimicrobia bacterium]|jgi:copper homeostasis protein|nr:copper homeostasis protein CutC [Candidatus Neomarinimicrobiota bacterium]MDP6610951.1 copper homeostasis protein CutC [Candidatus Neomarinimicrobiota bacterium]|tara:strand:+ start:1588 stop:1902 length:315 start_codon:yes stop_codon:yes gene_type:complete